MTIKYDVTIFQGVTVANLAHDLNRKKLEEVSRKLGNKVGDKDGIPLKSLRTAGLVVHATCPTNGVQVSLHTKKKAWVPAQMLQPA